MSSWITRQQLEALSTEKRLVALAELRTQIDARLRGVLHRGEPFWDDAHAIIDELKRQAQHDLWSHDYDGQGSELWGWNYMTPAGAGRLQIQFTFGEPCRTFWRGEDGRLGVDRDDQESGTSPRG